MIGNDRRLSKPEMVELAFDPIIPKETPDFGKINIPSNF